MSIHYYLTVFPMEALIASELEPEQFGAYMATGSKKGSSEQLIFTEVEEDCSDAFDWESARKKCVPHTDGRPKHSYYLSVYRVLENIPVKNLGTTYLITRDGRSLPIPKQTYSNNEWKGYALYKELCPLTPLVASSLDPKKFGEYMTDTKNMTSVPSLFFADLRIIDDLENMQDSGNIGNVYDRHPQHLKDCIDSLKSGKGKVNKIVDRTYSNRFSYQVIDKGLYAVNGTDVAFYPMPTKEELKKINYDWGKSADIF